MTLPLEKQVTSLNLSKRLKELGVKWESLYRHWATEVEFDGLTWWEVAEHEPRKGKRIRQLSTPEHDRGPISAFTVTELGEMLPDLTESVRSDGYWHTKSQDGMSTDKTEPDSRARLLIHLIETKIIDPATL